MRNLESPSPAVSPLCVTRYAGPLDGLAHVWTQLCDPQHPGAPFRSIQWVSSWWKHNSTSRDPLVLVAHRGEEVVGLLPAYTEPTSLGGRRVRLMGDGIVGSDYLGPLSADRDLPAVARAFAEHLQAGGFDELELDDLVAEDPLVEALIGAGGQSQPRYRCPFIRIEGSFAEFLAQLPDGIGPQLKRRKKWLEKFPDYRVEVLKTPHEIERGMNVLCELHRKRWALEGGSEAIDGPRVEAFHRDAAMALAGIGWSRIYLLHVDGAPRAALYGWRHGNRLGFYQAGHEPAWRPRSVGTVLLGDILSRCFEEGLDEFDFLRGEEPYKLRWATGWRQTVRVRLRGTGLRPWLDEQRRVLLTRVRETTKRALPPKAVAWVRAQRRALTLRQGGAR